MLYSLSVYVCLYVCVCVCVYVSSHSQVLLRLPHASTSPLDPTNPACTLDSLHLLPRCVLLASTMSGAERDANFKQVVVRRRGGGKRRVCVCICAVLCCPETVSFAAWAGLG